MVPRPWGATLQRRKRLRQHRFPLIHTPLRWLRGGRGDLARPLATGSGCERDRSEVVEGRDELGGRRESGGVVGLELDHLDAGVLADHP